MGKHTLISPARRRLSTLAVLVPGTLALAATPALAGTSPKAPPPPPSTTTVEQSCVDNVICVDAIDEGVGTSIEDVLSVSGAGS